MMATLQSDGKELFDKTSLQLDSVKIHLKTFVSLYE